MNFSPVFFDKYRLSSIATSAYDGTDYQPVDKWVLGQRFSGQGLGPVANAEYPMLVLDSITHTGQGGTATTTDDITLPPTLFAYTFLANRVDLPVRFVDTVEDVIPTIREAIAAVPRAELAGAAPSHG